MERRVPRILLSTALGVSVASAYVNPSSSAQEPTTQGISVEEMDQPVINDRSTMIRVMCLPVGQEFHIYVDYQHMVVNSTTIEHEGNYAIVMGDPDKGERYVWDAGYDNEGTEMIVEGEITQSLKDEGLVETTPINMVANFVFGKVGEHHLIGWQFRPTYEQARISILSACDSVLKFPLTFFQ